MASHTWKAYIQYNGDGIASYITIEFPVSDEMYEKIQSAIAADKPLSQCDFYDELVNMADESFDFADYKMKEDDDIVKPERSAFSDEEKFQTELKEYESYRKYIHDNWYPCPTLIDDPGDFPRFKKKFIGRYFENLLEESEFMEYEFEEEEERAVRYVVRVYFDEDGMITDIDDLEVEAMEWEGVGTSSWGEAYPDYEFLEEALLEELGDELDSDNVEEE